MNAATVQLRKELALIRLVWWAGLGLALCPLLLQPFAPASADVAWAAWLFLLYPAFLLPAMELFGREFTGGTFSLLMVQPLARRRLWWQKLRALAVAVGSVLGLFWLTSCMAAALGGGDLPLLFWLGSLGVAFTALGFTLFYSLTVRQATGVFWLSALTPLGLMGVVSMLPDQIYEVLFGLPGNVGNVPIWCVFGTPVLLAGVGWVLAYRKFRVIQDVDLLDRDITLPWLARSRVDGARRTLSRTPVWRQLVGKELRLQQGNALVVAAFAVLMGAVFALNRAVEARESWVLEMLRMVWLLVWFLVPMLVGAVAVADQRRLGMHDWQLVLPVARRRQWWLKVGVVYVVALVLGVALPLGMEVGLALCPVLDGADARAVAVSRVVAWILGTTLGLYASTLSRHVMQSLSTVALLCVVGAALTSAAKHWLWASWFTPLPLLALLSTGFLVPTLLLLGQRNHGESRIGNPLVARNAVTIAGVLALSGVLTAGIWNRAWEVFARDPVPGKALEVNPGVHYGIKSDYTSWARPLILTPAGRLWSLGNYTRSASGAGWHELGLGSTWVDAAGYGAGAVALRADGTLWAWGGWFVATNTVSQTIRWEPRGDIPWQIGADSDWVAVAAGTVHVLGLKRDGTLWGWGANSRGQLGEVEGVVADAPVLLPGGTNCALVAAGWDATVAVRKDGSVWLWRRDNHLLSRYSTSEKKTISSSRAGEFPRQLARRTDIAGIHVWGGDRVLAISRAGTALIAMMPYVDPSNELERFVDLTEVPLKDVTAAWMPGAGGLVPVGIGRDGSMWRWSANAAFNALSGGSPVSGNLAKRVGARTDWISVWGSYEGWLGMTADGGLWQSGGEWLHERSFWTMLVPPSSRPRMVARLGGD